MMIDALKQLAEAVGNALEIIADLFAGLQDTIIRAREKQRYERESAQIFLDCGGCISIEYYVDKSTSS